MTNGWNLLLDLVATLAGAFVLGAAFERIRLNAVLGYIVAGLILGPSVSGVVRDVDTVRGLAEIGVALLLFTIGLEFSFARLRLMGARGLISGALQVLLTTGAVACLAVALGHEWRAALALGAIAALSSTAIVLRILKETGALDAVHGRAALVILLVQDIALIPLVLLFAFLGEPGAARPEGSPSLLTAVVVVVGSFVLLTRVVPRALASRVMGQNRDLPILLAIVVCIAATYVAHALGISPSLGAFMAGMLLAETQFADQLRVDVAPLRTLFVTVFFASIGMLADVRWIGANLPLVFGTAAAVLLLKTALVFGILRAMGNTIVHALAAGIALSQIGELSFVLSELARKGSLLDAATNQLVNSVAVVTLLVSPILVTRAPSYARTLAKRLFRLRFLAQDFRERAPTSLLSGHIVVAGLGEAGLAFVRSLEDAPCQMVLIDVNVAVARELRTQGYQVHLGDATQTGILTAAALRNADTLVVAVSDHDTARLIISAARRLSPDLHIVARARYHKFSGELQAAGATLVVDEERSVGRTLADEVRRVMPTR
ncbi:MAG: cation:proton antiporter [Fimbriimonadaceae bacterium]|nr:cation:proton antiporter [Fimbriimonadaceae bacterium]